MRSLLVLAAALTIALAVPVQAVPALPTGSAQLMEYDPALVGSPPYRRLFMDAMVVEESANLERVFHQVTKYERNPILIKDKPWEGWGPSLGGSVLSDGNKLRMYYYCIDGSDCVAESTDGLRWTKPNVGIVDYKGSKNNNIVRCATQVYKLKNPPSPDRKWVALTNMHLSYSPDGLHWTSDRSKGELFSSSDVVNFFVDPYKNRMAATWKTSNRRHRAAGVVWSNDLATWTKPYAGPVMVADDLDPDPTQIYGMPVFAYQGCYIGLPVIYHARWLKYGKYTKSEVMFEAQEGSPRNLDVQLAWSWDLVHWTRTPKREPFIPNGPSKQFDCGILFTANQPVLMGDEVWFYYSGWDQIHEDYEGIRCALGLAKLRLDGFCSMHANGREGWFISRREVFNVPRVGINAKCAADGYVTAEIVDRWNKVIPGFEKENCRAFTGDSVRAELTWKNAGFAKDWIDKDKKIKFYIRNADLYSYLPVGINTQIDDSDPD